MPNIRSNTLRLKRHRVQRHVGRIVHGDQFDDLGRRCEGRFNDKGAWVVWVWGREDLFHDSLELIGDVTDRVGEGSWEGHD